jgi:hypothetical protein
MIRRRSIAALVALAATAGAAMAAPDFDAQLRELGGLCLTGSSARCYARAFAAADRDGDGRLALSEAEALRQDLQAWSTAHLAELAPADRNGLLLALLAVQLTGVAALFNGFDTDRDGYLSPEELSADVNLDDRPVAVLIRDPAAVDWQRLLGRLGAASGLLEGVAPAPIAP